MAKSILIGKEFISLHKEEDIDYNFFIEGNQNGGVVSLISEGGIAK